MRKKFKRYAGAGMAAALFLTAVPMHPVSGADLANSESVVESETGIEAEDAGSVADYQEESAAFSTIEEDISENEQAGADSEDVTAAFTDPSFLAEVRKALNLGENDPITKSACAAVTELNVNGMNIKTLAGIENFTELTSLFCRENQLTELDLTKCPQLVRLECHDNPIKTLNVSQCPNLRSLHCIGSQLTELDVTQCPNLTNLWCGSQLKAIDLSQCPKLQAFGCRSGQLSALDVSGCPELQKLYCDGNQLTVLDVSRCPNLETLYCNENQLTGLELGTGSSLQDLWCYDNQLSKLDVTQCYNLKELSCYGNNIGELNISQCINLNRLDCTGNQIKALDVSGCTALTSLRCSGNPLERFECCHNMLSELSIGSDQLTKLDCSGNRLSRLTLSRCSSLTDLNCSNNYLKELSLSGCENLVKLDCSYNYMESLNAVTGKGDSLTEENFTYEPQNIDTDITKDFTDINFRSAVKEILNLGENDPITKIACAKLGKSLNVSNKGIKDLAGIKHFINITGLLCQNNELTQLDVSGLVNLDRLECEGNQLTTLNAEGCANLTLLFCSRNFMQDGYYSKEGGNRLKELNVSNCTKLERLVCPGNELTQLDLEGLAGLEELLCKDNILSVLDVNNCSNLRVLECEENKLIELHVDKCANLESLTCYNNQLEVLNVNKCINLLRLGCSENQLSALDISSCINLKWLNCSKNNMKTPDNVNGKNDNLTGENFIFVPQNSDTSTQAPKKAQKMTVKPGSLELYVGGSTKNLKVSNAKGSITYKSSNPKIVKVNSKGKVTPVSKGKVYITVKASGDSTYEAASKKINVTVYGKPAKVKGVKSSPAKAKRTVKVSWKKAPSVSGYIIKYSYNKNMKNSETIRVNNGRTTSKTIKKLTSKKYVYIQVQAYNKDGSALIKSSWSIKTRSSGKIK